MHTMTISGRKRSVENREGGGVEGLKDGWSGGGMDVMEGLKDGTNHGWSGRVVNVGSERSS